MGKLHSQTPEWPALCFDDGSVSKAWHIVDSRKRRNFRSTADIDEDSFSLADFIVYDDKARRVKMCMAFNDRTVFETSLPVPMMMMASNCRGMRCSC